MKEEERDKEREKERKKILERGLVKK